MDKDSSDESKKDIDYDDYEEGKENGSTDEVYHEKHYAPAMGNKSAQKNYNKDDSKDQESDDESGDDESTSTDSTHRNGQCMMKNMRVYFLTRLCNICNL